MAGKQLVAGLLTAAALTAFADNRALAQNAPVKDAAATTQPAAKDETPQVKAITKDGKQLLVNISVPPLKGGQIPDGVYGQMLGQFTAMYTMSTLQQYNEADIPKNIDKIQKQISEGLAKTLTLGATPDGKVENGKEGVNFGPPVISRVTEADGGKKVIFEKPAAPVKAPATQPAMKA